MDKITTSDVAGLGLSPKPARPKGFLGCPSPPEARSAKPESPAGFFGPNSGRIPAKFQAKIGQFSGNFSKKKLKSSIGRFNDQIYIDNHFMWIVFSHFTF